MRVHLLVKLPDVLHNKCFANEKKMKIHHYLLTLISFKFCMALFTVEHKRRFETLFSYNECGHSKGMQFFFFYLCCIEESLNILGELLL